MGEDGEKKRGWRGEEVEMDLAKFSRFLNFFAKDALFGLCLSRQGCLLTVAFKPPRRPRRSARRRRRRRRRRSQSRARCHRRRCR